MEEKPYRVVVCTAVPKLKGMTFRESETRAKRDIDWQSSFDELKSLVESYGGQIVGEIVQKVEKPNTAYFLGKGKIEELKKMVTEQKANVIVFDSQLSTTQLRNITNLTGAEVLDREYLIIKIFAQRAYTLEGKFQVELAEQRYRLSKLIGMGKEMSQLGAKLGTRGPGEQKIEEKRRHLKEKIRSIERKLNEIRNTREIQRLSRKKKGIKEISLIGYTNSGKSTLLKAMTKENVKIENKLFSTLDTRVGSISINTYNHSDKILVADTVGFIRYIPHSLIEAFKSTLEEILFSDALLYVIDATWDWDVQIQTIDSVLDEISNKNNKKPKIFAFNKIDLLSSEDLNRIKRFGDVVPISAKKMINLDALKNEIYKVLR